MGAAVKGGEEQIGVNDEIVVGRLVCIYTHSQGYILVYTQCFVSRGDSRPAAPDG